MKIIIMNYATISGSLRGTVRNLYFCEDSFIVNGIYQKEWLKEQTNIPFLNVMRGQQVVEVMDAAMKRFHPD